MKLERALAAHLLETDPAAAARALEALPDAAALTVLATAPSREGASVLSQIAPHRGSELLAAMRTAEAEQILDELGADHAADLVRRLPPRDRKRFVDSLAPEYGRALSALLDLPSGTAGALMDSRVLALPEDVTVADAVTQIRQSPQHVRYNLYVVDRERRLVGVLNLRELLLADPGGTLGSIALREVLSIFAGEDRRAVLEHPAWREAHSLPVVDRRGVYLGAIRYRTWRRLADEADRGRGTAGYHDRRCPG